MNSAVPSAPAGIARGRLNPDILERPFAQDAAIADAIERHAAGQHQVLHAGARVDMPRTAQHHILGHGLDRGGQIHFALRDARLHFTRRAAEEGVKFGRRHRQSLTVVEVAHIQAERAIFLQIDEVLANQRFVNRPAVGASPISLYSPLLTRKPV